MRNVLIAVMLAPPLLSLLAMIVLRAQLVAFQRAGLQIRTEDDLRRLKRLASFQMYVSLVLLWADALPLLTWIYGKFIAGVLGWLDLPLYVILPFVALIVAAMVLGGPADAVRATPAATRELEQERERVADVWVNRNFPEW